MNIFIQNIFLVLLSFCIYTIPFFFEQFFLLESFFLIPIIYIIYKNKKIPIYISFLFGFLISFSSCFGPIDFIYSYSSQSTYFLFRYLPPLFLPIVVGLYSLIFFSIFNFVLKIVNNLKLYQQIIIFLLLVYLFFIFLEYFGFLFFGVLIGCPFLNPVIPIASNMNYIYLIKYIGLSNYLMMIILSNGILSYIILYKWLNIIFIIFSILFAFSPYIISFILSLYIKAELPQYLNKIKVIQSELYFFYQDQEKLSDIINASIKSIMKYYKDTLLILTPELFASGYNFYKNNSLLLKDLNYDKLTILFAGDLPHEELNDRVYNCVYHIHNSKLVNCYKKRKLIPFIEFIPEIYRSSLIKDIFFKYRSEYIHHHNDHEIVKLYLDDNNFQNFVLYICSEFFFNFNLDDDYNYPIIALCGDFWSKFNYFKKVMYFIARIKALNWNRDIIYITYYYKYFISKDGFDVKLK